MSPQPKNSKLKNRNAKKSIVALKRTYKKIFERWHSSTTKTSVLIENSVKFSQVLLTLLFGLASSLGVIYGMIHILNGETSEGSFFLYRSVAFGVIFFACTLAAIRFFLRRANRLEEELRAGGFFRTQEMQPTVMRNLKNMLSRTQMTSQEINTFHGMITVLMGRKGK